jgi:hypothetical protein
MVDYGRPFERDSPLLHLVCSGEWDPSPQPELFRSLFLCLSVHKDSCIVYSAHTEQYFVGFRTNLAKSLRIAAKIHALGAALCLVITVDFRCLGVFSSNLIIGLRQRKAMKRLPMHRHIPPAKKKPYFNVPPGTSRIGVVVSAYGQFSSKESRRRWTKKSVLKIEYMDHLQSNKLQECSTFTFLACLEVETC